MKTSGFIGVVIIAMAMLVALTGCAMAAKPVNQTPETQGIVTSTAINAQGTVTETESLSWTIVNNGPINKPPLGDEEVQYSTGYNQNVMAVSGLTQYNKAFAVDTANKIADGSNVKVGTNIQYIAVDTGRMTFSEDILLDGAGESSVTANSMLCPFGPSTSAVIPDFCNIVQMGSSMDVTLVSAETSASDRFVAATADVPNAVAYSISAKGLAFGNTSVPAVGTVSAFMKAHIMEARGDSDEKSEDLTYSETSSASGLINSFVKTMSYQDGMRRF